MKNRSRALWILQVLLAVFFALGSGAPKLLIPAEQLPMPIPLPQPFVWFIGALAACVAYARWRLAPLPRTAPARLILARRRI